MMKLLSTFQKFIITNKKLIIWVFRVLYIWLILAWMWGAYVFVNAPENYIAVYRLGKNFGIVAFLLYLITLIPGILRRFQVLPLLQASIMPLRRQIGVLMFLFALVHMGYTSSIPVFFAQPFEPPVLNSHQVYGLLSMLILLPLWLTSNDIAQKGLGRKWTYLHRATYVALFFIFLHVTFTNRWLTILGGIFIALEAISWGKQLFFKKPVQAVPGRS